jgi:hypothetical protein
VFTFANDGGLSVKKSHLYTMAKLGMTNRGLLLLLPPHSSFPLLSSQNFRGTLVGLSWWRRQLGWGGGYRPRPTARFAPACTWSHMTCDMWIRSKFPKLKKKVDFHKICCLFSLNTFNKIKLVASRTLKLLGDW